MRHQSPGIRSLSWLHLARGLAVAAALYAFVYYPHSVESWQAKALQHYLDWTASAAAFTLRALGQDASASGDLVTGSFSMQVVLDCAALDVLALVAAAIIVVPTTIARRACGVVVAWVVILSANIGRLTLLYWVGGHAHQWFDVLHEEVLAIMMVVVSLGVFAGWVGLIRGPVPPPGAGAVRAA